VEGLNVAIRISLQCTRQDVPLFLNEVSRATLFSTLCGFAGATPILGVAVRRFRAAAVALLTALSLAQAQEVVRDPTVRAIAEHNLALELEGCPAVPACLVILDAFVSPLDDGRHSSAARAIADKLRRFGEPGKQELLRRAAGAHPGWRNLAGDILQYWGAWSPSDVPAIRAALQLQHGGWIARPLAAIRSPEAIQALVEDLAFIGAESQTGWALVQTGPTALPYLLPILADDQHASAAVIIGRMGREALVAAPDWASVATSADNPKKVRLAALRGLAAMGDGAQQQGKDLREMLASPDIDIRAQVFETLVAIRDPSVVTTVAENCNPSGTAFSKIPYQSFACLKNVATFGEHALPAGSQLLKFLLSPNGEELAAAVTALGYIGYDAAVPQIEQQLRSPDWRVVYAAARSLGWLAATGSIRELERVAFGHWLPEVRDQASAVVDALKGSGRRMARPPSVDGPDRARLFFMGRSNLRPLTLCGSRRWEWHDIQFSLPPPSTRAARLSLGAGELVGTNRGEWGGELAWKPADGQAQPIIKDNVIAIEAAEGGAIVLFGLAHLGWNYGYAVRVSQRDDGGWSLSEVARLPSKTRSQLLAPNCSRHGAEKGLLCFQTKKSSGWRDAA
jgi:HEAT repeat protein